MGLTPLPSLECRGEDVQILGFLRYGEFITQSPAKPSSQHAGEKSFREAILLPSTWPDQGCENGTTPVITRP